jgi:DNA-binding Lrp family transcriptional regulator
MAKGKLYTYDEDQKILDAYREHGSASYPALSEELGRSVAALSGRVNKLRKNSGETMHGNTSKKPALIAEIETLLDIKLESENLNSLHNINLIVKGIKSLESIYKDTNRANSKTL